MQEVDGKLYLHLPGKGFRQFRKSNMTVVKSTPAAACGRVDPKDGKLYTRDQFVQFYSAIYPAGNSVRKLR